MRAVKRLILSLSKDDVGEGLSGMIDRNDELAGKVAIVTGSARNIGRTTAEELARAGAAVVINAVRDKALCEEVAHGIESAGGRAITSQQDVERMVQAATDAFGGIDILINNAAVRINSSFTELTFDIWERMRAVALDGAFRMSMACAPSMIERGEGSVVGIHGLNSYTASSVGSAHRSAVKDGMAGMLRGMARDLGPHGITCNIAAVGPFDTDRASGSGETTQRGAGVEDIPMGRRGTPQDMADMVRFLVGPFARYISGQTFLVAGGTHMAH
jgi:3-oxoacyl-[acyl-carrier protein] reductase